MTDEVFEGDVLEEATPKAGILTISQGDAQALHDFEVFVGGDCFDVWDRDGTRSKSDLLMKHLAKMRALLAETGEARTISQDDAKAIHDFDNFVGRDCFDVRLPNGGRGKSLPLMKHMDRMRELLHKLMDYPEVETGFYTTPLCEVHVETLNPLLTAEIGGRSSLRGYCANVFSIPDAVQFGSLEFFIDEQSGEACGLFLIPHGFEMLIAGPGWTKCGTDIDATVQIFLDAIPDDDVLFGDNEAEDVCEHVRA
jgi:hypothetical protein